MPRRPQRRPHLRGHVQDLVEAVISTAGNPFAQFTRLGSRPSSTKKVEKDEDIPASWKRERETPVMAPAPGPVPKKQKAYGKPFKKQLPMIKPEPSKTEASLLDLRSSVQAEKMSTKNETGSGNDAGLKETPVDDPFNIQRGPPDYAFATLPYVTDRTDSSSAWMRQHTYRMTSCYDVIVPQSNDDLNVGAGTLTAASSVADSSDGSAQKARWFDLYASMYKYYHVIACRWHLTFENQSTLPVWLHQYYGNAEDRPALATNADMMLWGDTQSHYVGPAAIAITAQGYTERFDLPTGDNVETAAASGGQVAYETSNHVQAKGPSYILQLSGEYRPGDFDREIKTDAMVENWTLTSANPLLTERLHFRIRPQADSLNTNNASNYNTLLTYRMFLRLEYLVEFKELQPGLKYPVASQPAVFSITTSS